MLGGMERKRVDGDRGRNDDPADDELLNEALVRGVKSIKAGRFRLARDVIADLRARSILMLMVPLLVACAGRSEDPQGPEEPVCAEGASNVDGTCRCEASHIGAICEEGGARVVRATFRSGVALR